MLPDEACLTGFYFIYFAYIRYLIKQQMKPTIALLACLFLFSCIDKPTNTSTSLIGTWQLVAATSTQGDSTVSTFDPKHKMIKIINATHFAFLNHSIDRVEDTTASAFDAGGGTYTLKDSNYTEHLEYYSDKQWENNSFSFTIHLSNDTLVQRGVEKVEKLGVDHIIIETYKRVTQ